MKRHIGSDADVTAQAEAMEPEKGVTVRQAGARGGRSTRDRHGVEFLKKIAKKGGDTTKKRYGHLFAEYGRRGGRPRRPSLHGMEEGTGKLKEELRSAHHGAPPPE